MGDTVSDTIPVTRRYPNGLYSVCKIRLTNYFPHSIYPLSQAAIVLDKWPTVAAYVTTTTKLLNSNLT